MSCVAMTAVCLAFSSLFNSPEKANVVSIYLVGFQLPLSGVVLALPEALKWVCRPFISTYWGWAGYMSSMRDTRIYDAYVQTRAAWEYLPSASLSVGGNGGSNAHCRGIRLLRMRRQKVAVGFPRAAKSRGWSSQKSLQASLRRVRMRP